MTMLLSCAAWSTAPKTPKNTQGIPRQEFPAGDIFVGMTHSFGVLIFLLSPF